MDDEVRFTGQRWALADVRLLAPIFASKVVCVGRNYVEHAAEHGAEVPAEPLIFLKPSTSVIGPNAVIRLPPQSRQVEHEAELAVVIGPRPVRRVGRGGARARLFWDARAHHGPAPGPPRKDGQWNPGQGLDPVFPRAPGGTTRVALSHL